MISFRSILIAGVFILASMNAMANVKIIFATVPPDREVIRPPRGYANCQIVAAGFYDGIWINKHRICHYSHHRGTWISGYWQCNKVKKGFCARWDWAPSRWEGPHVAAYPPMQPRPVAYPAPAVAYGPAPIQRPPVPIVAPQPMPQPSPAVVGQQPVAAASPVIEQLPPQPV